MSYATELVDDSAVDPECGTLTSRRIYDFSSVPPDPLTDLADRLAAIRGANPALEFWLDSHPCLHAAGQAGTDDLGATLGQGVGSGAAIRLSRQLTGITTNPNLIDEYDQVRRGADPRAGRADAPGSAAERYAGYVSEAAATMRGLHEQSDARAGWVSAQVSPSLSLDTRAIVEQGLSLAALSPNVMVKIPGTAAGYRAIRTLVARGVSVNGTLSYSLAQFRCFALAVAAARQGLSAEENRRVRTVVTHMAGRVGDAVLGLWPSRCGSGGRPAVQQLRLAESALARRGAAIVAEIEPCSTVLLSSVRVDPALPQPCLHVAAMIDRRAVFTLKPATFAQLAAVDLDPVFSPAAELGREVDEWAPGADTPSVIKVLFDEGLDPDRFWTLPPFLLTLAEASASQLRLAEAWRAA